MWRTRRKLKRDRELLAQALIRVGAYPMHYARTREGIIRWAEHLVDTNQDELDQ